MLLGKERQFLDRIHKKRYDNLLFNYTGRIMRKIFLFCFIFLFHLAASADLYRILGVMPDSPLEKITKNYERAKERIHPEHNSNSRESRERLQN